MKEVASKVEFKTISIILVSASLEASDGIGTRTAEEGAERIWERRKNLAVALPTLYQLQRVGSRGRNAIMREDNGKRGTQTTSRRYCTDR